MRKQSILALLTLGAAATTGPAFGDDLYGPLRERDLSPFGFVRLDMHPSHAVAIEPGTWAFESTIGYQNTWALSPNVEHYLHSIEPLGRHQLTQADVQAIQNLPGENYLVDTELGLYELTAHYKISTRWSLYLIGGAVSYQGGFLDGAIEKFHSTLGFSDFGRPAVRRNDVNVVFDLKGVQATYLGLPTRGGLLDPVVGLRYTGITLPGSWRLVLESAVKPSFQGEKLLRSTGRTDYGLQAALQWVGNRQAVYINTSAVYFAGQPKPFEQDSQVIPTLVVGYELSLTAHTNVNVQGYISPSVYKREQTDLDELRGEKYQISIGVRHRREHFLYSFGFTENLQNINNTPDIGLQFGVAYLPSPH
jgi:hypothetical protein